MKIDDDLGALKKKLQELAEVINSFKSEAVQLRVLELLFNGTHIEPETSEKTQKSSAKRRKTAQVKQDKGKPDRVAGKKQKRTVSRKSAYAIVSGLVDDGFFKKPQTIRGIIEHLRTQKGHHFKSNEISPSLLRLIRNDILTRKKNKDNQYEYIQA